MKKTIIAISLMVSSGLAFSLTDGQAAILGIAIGSQIQRHAQQEQYQQPQRHYPSGVYYQPAQQYQDPCTNAYSRVDSAYCRGAQRRFADEVRNLERDAYNRGYNGN